MNVQTDNHNLFKQRVFGTIYGLGVGNALGLGAEFMDIDTISHYYPQGIDDYKTTAAAFWALWNSNDFERGVLQIVMRGGDADTNAAVAGSLLGAKFGIGNIPKKWIDNLYNNEILQKDAEKFYNLLEENDTFQGNR